MRINSARQAIHDAHALGFLSQGLDIEKMLSMDFKSTRGSKDMNWQHVDKAEAGLIMNALAGLEPHLQAWAIWCYGPQIAEYLPEQGRFFNWLNDDVGIRLLESERNYRPATAAKVRDVVACSVLDYRSYTNTDRHEYPVKRICKECGIVQNNWHRDFKQWHDYGWALCDRLDKQVLPVVASVVRRINFDPRKAGAWGDMEANSLVRQFIKPRLRLNRCEDALLANDSPDKKPKNMHQVAKKDMRQVAMLHRQSVVAFDVVSNGISFASAAKKYGIARETVRSYINSLLWKCMRRTGKSYADFGFTDGFKASEFYKNLHLLLPVLLEAPEIYFPRLKYPEAGE